MRQHCAQCLTEVFATGRETPKGRDPLRTRLLGALGPKASEELRPLVRLHTGRPRRNGQVVPQQA